MQGLGGQTRTVAGMDQLLHLGWDATAVLALARARGLDARLLAEWLPAIEYAAMTAINKD